MTDSRPVPPTTSIFSLRKEKIQKIEDCLSEKDVNLWQLRELCLTRGGLMTADLRRRSWHKLVGIDPDGCNLTKPKCKSSLDEAHCHERGGNCNTDEADIGKLEDSFAEDTELISRDVGRAVYFRYSIEEATRGINSPEKGNYIDSGQNMLTKIIVSTISNNRENVGGGRLNRLNYYQGFHDVASVIFVNMPREPELACSILQRIAQSHLRDTMMEDFSYVSALLEIVFYPLLQVIDEKLHDYLILRELGPTVFLTWMITLFSHDIHDSEIASRMFDAIIASHPVMPLYFTVAILTHGENRQRLFDANKDEAAMLQKVATDLVSRISHDFVSTNDGFSAQDVIDSALGYMKKIPPESLLKLAQNYDLGQSELLMKRCESLYLFKSPQSWALKTNYCPNKDEIECNAAGEVKVSLSVPKHFPNAKIATGVSSIMTDGENTSGVAYVKKFGDFLQSTLHMR